MKNIYYLKRVESGNMSTFRFENDHNPGYFNLYGWGRDGELRE